MFVFFRKDMAKSVKRKSEEILPFSTTYKLKKSDTLDSQSTVEYSLDEEIKDTMDSEVVKVKVLENGRSSPRVATSPATSTTHVTTTSESASPVGSKCGNRLEDILGREDSSNTTSAQPSKDTTNDNNGRPKNKREEKSEEDIHKAFALMSEVYIELGHRVSGFENMSIDLNKLAPFLIHVLKKTEMKDSEHVEYILRLLVKDNKVVIPETPTDEPTVEEFVETKLVEKSDRAIAIQTNSKTATNDADIEHKEVKASTSTTAVTPAKATTSLLPANEKVKTKKTNSIMADLRTLVKEVPNANADTMMAMLESHKDNPNRVEMVRDLLSQTGLPFSSCSPEWQSC